MAFFINVAAGETKTDDGIRLTVRPDGQAAWFHGKWLELGEDHAVIWVDGSLKFIRADGRQFLAGKFSAWVVQSSRKGGPCAMMINVIQVKGGRVEIGIGARKKVFHLPETNAVIEAT